eukprot:TRINITY_DN1450_c0_g1_i1.p1 TRINITY_DN1450_c0_g1~~TRINITY_DN1450_c0_g1_i1.p1  ORF type:complete len:235 (-),score=65.83 TRINITY_DN1450_c0_g1_i1:51-692(-)
MLAGVPLVVLFVLCIILAAFARREKALIFWLLFSGIVHLLLEGSYGFFHREVTAPATVTFMERFTQDVPMERALDFHWWASLYSQYAKYDGRYSISDPMVVFFCFTELVEGVLCFLLIALILNNSKYRHPVQIVCCTAQAFGTVFYFITPILYNTWDTVMTKDPFELWVYVIILNGLWMVVPGAMIIQSFNAISGAMGRQQANNANTKRQKSQ